MLCLLSRERIQFPIRIFPDIFPSLNLIASFEYKVKQQNSWGQDYIQGCHCVYFSNDGLMLIKISLFLNHFTLERRTPAREKCESTYFISSTHDRGFPVRAVNYIKRQREAGIYKVLQTRLQVRDI